MGIRGCEGVSPLPPGLLESWGYGKIVEKILELQWLRAKSSKQEQLWALGHLP